MPSPDSDHRVPDRTETITLAISQYQKCTRVLLEFFKLFPGDTSWRVDGIGSCDYHGESEPFRLAEGVFPDLRAVPTPFQDIQKVFLALRESQNREVPGDRVRDSCKYFRLNYGCTQTDLRGPTCISYTHPTMNSLPRAYSSLVGENGLFETIGDLNRFLRKILLGIPINQQGLPTSPNPNANADVVRSFVAYVKHITEAGLTEKSTSPPPLVQIQPARPVATDKHNTLQLRYLKIKSPRINTATESASHARERVRIGAEVAAKLLEGLQKEFPLLASALKIAPHVLKALFVAASVGSIVSDGVREYFRSHSTFRSVAAASRRFTVTFLETLAAAFVYMASVALIGVSGTPAAIVGTASLLLYGGVRLTSGESLSIERHFDEITRWISRKTGGSVAQSSFRSRM